MSSPDNEPHVAHLPVRSREFLLGELSPPDCVLSFRSQQFLAHSQVLCLSSPHIAHIISLRREEAESRLCSWRGLELPVVSVLPAAPPGPPLLLENCSAAHFGAFLEHVYSHSREAKFQCDTLDGVLALADYFGAGDVLAQADAWLCEQCQHPEAEAACQAFEAAARHRLGGTMALLLPWAVQCMARSSRCTTVWYDGKQRCNRLQTAFADPQLKCLVLDAYWWSRQASEACPTCGCRPADIEASWDTRQEWAAPPAPPLRHGSGGATAAARAPLHPTMYARAVQHYAHLLQEAKWGCTPAHQAGAT